MRWPGSVHTAGVVRCVASLRGHNKINNPRISHDIIDFPFGQAPHQAASHVASLQFAGEGVHSRNREVRHRELCCVLLCVELARSGSLWMCLVLCKKKTRPDLCRSFHVTPQM